MDGASSIDGSCSSDGPVATTSSTTFRSFPKLPHELQTLIWEHTARLPRNLDIWARSVGSLNYQWTSNTEMIDYKPFKLYTNHRVPNILHINQASRAIGLQHYKLSFGTTFDRYDDLRITTPPRIYHNFSADRICPMGDYSHDQYAEIFSLRPSPSCAFNLAVTERAGDHNRVLDLVSAVEGFNEEILLYFLRDDYQIPGIEGFVDVVIDDVGPDEQKALLTARGMLVRQFDRWEAGGGRFIWDQARTRRTSVNKAPELIFVRPKIRLVRIVVEGVVARPGYTY